MGGVGSRKCCLVRNLRVYVLVRCPSITNNADGDGATSRRVLGSRFVVMRCVPKRKNSRSPSQSMSHALKKLIAYGSFLLVFFAGLATSWGFDAMNGGWRLMFGLAWFVATTKLVAWIVRILGWEESLRGNAPCGSNAGRRCGGVGEDVNGLVLAQVSGLPFRCEVWARMASSLVPMKDS